MKRASHLFVMLAFWSPSISFAKHVVPAKVPPVHTANMRIEVPLDDGKVGRIQAFDRADGHLLWSLVVFKNRIYPWREECVQWRFITGMAIVGEALDVTVEDGRHYRVLLATRKVERLAVAPKPTTTLGHDPC